MSVLEVFLLTAILVIGVFTAYTDTRLRRISNTCTFGLAFLGALGQAIFVYLGLLTILQCLWLILGGLSIAFLLFTLGVWSPGDAKLFWAIASAVCPSFRAKHRSLWF